MISLYSRKFSVSVVAIQVQGLFVLIQNFSLTVVVLLWLSLVQSPNSQIHRSMEIHFAIVHCKMPSTKLLLYNVIYKMPAATARG